MLTLARELRTQAATGALFGRFPQHQGRASAFLRVVNHTFGVFLVCRKKCKFKHVNKRQSSDVD